MVAWFVGLVGILIFGYATVQLFRRRGDVPKHVWVMLLYLFLPVALLAILTLPAVIRQFLTDGP